MKMDVRQIRRRRLVAIHQQNKLLLFVDFKTRN